MDDKEVEKAKYNIAELRQLLEKEFEALKKPEFRYF